MDELRSKHLFAFSHLLHTPPPMVDALRYTDFIQMILEIEAYNEAMERERNRVR